MKSKEFTLLNIFLVVVILFFVILTVRLSSNTDFVTMFNNIAQNDVTKVVEQSKINTCTSKPLLNLKATTDQHIRKLQEYQGMCGSFITDQLMFFTSFPEDQNMADELAAEVSEKLKEFNEFDIRPIVIAEPYISSGAMSYRAYLNGAYDQALDRFFSQLKKSGINDSMMGIWVPFPESNTPSWDNKDTEPRDFALAVNKYLGTMKLYFPLAKGSVLLNATTYEPTDIDYENGDYLSLVPYLQDVNKNFVDSIGIQGFPWVSRATNVHREIFRASEFLQSDYAIGAAQELRTRDIWFNTGSFSTKYTNEDTQRVQVSPSDRKAVLSGILEELKRIQNFQQNGYRLTVNIFAEDKSDSKEATDWSYFQDDNNKTVLREFIKEASDSGLGISLYDKYK